MTIIPKVLTFLGLCCLGGCGNPICARFSIYAAPSGPGLPNLEDLFSDYAAPSGPGLPNFSQITPLTWTRYAQFFFRLRPLTWTWFVLDFSTYAAPSGPSMSMPNFFSYYALLHGPDMPNFFSDYVILHGPGLC